MLRRDFLHCAGVLLCPTLIPQPRKTTWLGPIGKWSDPSMWNNGIPDKHCDAHIIQHGHGRVICVIDNWYSARCNNLVIGDKCHLKGNLHIAGSLSVGNMSTFAINPTDAIDWNHADEK